jgi:RNA exonuclease 1
MASTSAVASSSSSGSATKKYKLRSIGNTTTDSKSLPCAFFSSAQGCRSGDSCKFSHDVSICTAAVEPPLQNTKKEKRQEKDFIKMDDTVVSSESSDGEVDHEQSVKSRKVKSISQNADSPFLSAEELKKNKATNSDTKKRTIQESNKNPFANTSESKKQKKTNIVASAPKLDFRSMNLPVASFVMSGNEPVETSTVVSKYLSTSSSNSKNKTSLVNAAAEVAASPAPQTKPTLSLPTSTPAGRKWVHMVQKTRDHPRYSNLYDLSKYMEQDKNAGYAIDSLWVKTTPFEKTKGENPQIIAIDCEMCETMDPVTQQKDHRALCRVSIIDIVKDEVLLDSLVKPPWPVTNYRTWVNGIAAEHLDNVQFTLRHAQAYLMALCSDETVIIGHAVHNDLAALRIDHATVVDSACLYSAVDSETAMVSLRDIVSHVLNIDMPEKHDSVNDARMAYQIVEHYCTKKGKVDSIPRSANTKSASFNGLRASDYASQLFVHRIPKNVCDETQLLQMFLSYTHVQPIKVDEIEYGTNSSTTPDHTNTSGKTHVHFSSGRHGNLAFDSLDGKAVADTSGRLQKKVFLKNGNYIRIRKMAYEASSSNPAQST